MQQDSHPEHNMPPPEHKGMVIESGMSAFSRAIGAKSNFVRSEDIK